MLLGGRRGQSVSGVPIYLCRTSGSSNPTYIRVEASGEEPHRAVGPLARQSGRGDAARRVARPVFRPRAAALAAQPLRCCDRALHPLGVEAADGSSKGEGATPDALQAAAEGFEAASGSEGEGVKTSFGELLVSKDGRFTLKDAAMKIVAQALSPPVLVKEATEHDGITMRVSGSKLGPGANGRRPCLVK